MKVTAKVTVSGKTSVSDGQTVVYFMPDYNDERNKEWAKYTPAMSFNMTVLDSVAELFVSGQPLLMTLEPDE